VPGLVHRYPDRVLFLITGFCSTYCRYCTRSRMVGGDEYTFSLTPLAASVDYIRLYLVLYFLWSIDLCCVIVVSCLFSRS